MRGRVGRLRRALAAFPPLTDALRHRLRRRALPGRASLRLGPGPGPEALKPLLDLCDLAEGLSAFLDWNQDVPSAVPHDAALPARPHDHAASGSGLDV